MNLQPSSPSKIAPQYASWRHEWIQYQQTLVSPGWPAISRLNPQRWACWGFATCRNLPRLVKWRVWRVFPRRKVNTHTHMLEMKTKNITWFSAWSFYHIVVPQIPPPRKVVKTCKNRQTPLVKLTLLAARKHPTVPYPYHPWDWCIYLQFRWFCMVIHGS